MIKFLHIILLSAFLLGINNQLLKAQIAISEINYNSDSLNSPGDWIELLNYSASSVDITGWKIMDSQPMNAFTIPGGTVMPPNGRLVLSENTTKFDQQFPGIPRLGNISFGLAGSGEQITLQDQNGIVKVQLTYDDSLPWSKCADGMGRTLEIINPQGNPNDPANWRCGCILGSPNAAFSPCTNEVVVVSEINYNSDSSANPEDWFELWNTSNSAVNISNWFVRDDNTSNVYQFPTNTYLNPQARLVVYRDLAAFSAQHPNVNNKIGPFSFGLGNSGDCIRLYDSQNKLKFTVCYSDKTPWPLEADGGGFTLELDTTFNPSKNVCSASSWFAGCKGGSPGKAFSPCNTSLEISNVNDASLLFYPNPSGDWIHLNHILDRFTKLELIDIQGRSVTTLNFLNDVNSPINISHLNPGVYVLKLHDSYGFKTSRLIIQR